MVECCLLANLLWCAVHTNSCNGWAYDVDLNFPGGAAQPGAGGAAGAAHVEGEPDSAGHLSHQMYVLAFG
jgi:hypothetical protein